MHIAASSSHHTLDANKETASSGGLAGNRRDKKGFWPVYYSLELFIIFTAFTDSEGGERLFIPKREGECVHSVSGVAVLCDGRKALDRRFQTGCLQLYPLLPCRVSEPHLKAAEEEKGGEGGDKHPRYKICNPRKLTNLTVSACRPPSGLVCVNLSTNSGSEWVTDAVHVSTGL